MVNRKSISRMFSVYLIVMFLLTGVLRVQRVQAEPLASPLYASGDFVWAKRMGATSYDRGFAIAVDSSGNVYTTGFFGDTVDFDPGAGTANLTSAGDSDIFISKLGNGGNLLWAKSMGGLNAEYGLGIAVDSSGNVYTTGAFRGTADFDPGAGIYNMTNAGLEDIFVSKLDGSGNFVWAKSMGGGDDELAYSIAVDSSGNVYTTGYFGGTIDFDPNVGGTAELTSVGVGDIFISKLDGSGSFVWAKSMGGTNYDQGYSIAVASSGNIYTTGFFYGTADFDPGAGTTNLTSMGLEDIFVSKLDGSGDFVWAKSIGGTSSDIGIDIAVDSSGSVYTTGVFKNTADFDPGAGTSNLTSMGLEDIFVSKLDGSGNFAWAKRMGGTMYDRGRGIALDSRDNVYTTGFFEGTADFDPGAGTTNLTSAGLEDIFVSKSDGSGNFVWAKSMGGTSYDIGRSIALDSSSNVYTTGSFVGTADFDPGAGTANLTSAGLEDIFVSKIHSTTFVDVPLTYWANSYIERLYNTGITGGCSVIPLNYCPDASVTRAQMAVLLLKGMHGSSYTPPAVGVSTGFTDVATDYWAAAWIKQLAAEDITSGCGAGNYCPDATVTRAQMAIFLLKAKYGSSYSPPAATGVFTDVPVGYWADKWIEQLAAEGITGGCGTGIYCPDSSVTRAQMAVFLVKTFNLP